MGWFDEQIRQRIKKDEDVFSGSFEKMSNMLANNSFEYFNELSDLTIQAIEKVLLFFHIKAEDIEDKLDKTDNSVDEVLRLFGIMSRDVALKKTWYKEAVCPLIAKTIDGEIIALIPKGHSYSYTDPKTRKLVTINKKNEMSIAREALCLYNSFPNHEIGFRDLLCYMLKLLKPSDLILFATLTLIVTLVGLIIPQINSILFSSVVISGDVTVLIALIIMMIGVTVSGLMLTMTKFFVMDKISTKIGIFIEAATMTRVLSLPVDFFKNHSSGDIGKRLNDINDLTKIFVSMFLSSSVTVLFSLIYFMQIFAYAPSLALPSVMIVLATVAVTLITVVVKSRVSLKQMNESAKERGIMFSIISGMQKIKLSGSERRVFARWTNQYIKSAKYTYMPPVIVKLYSVIILAITLIGNIFIYYFAVKSSVEVSDFVAFNTSFGMMFAAFSTLTATAMSISTIKPLIGMLAPIFKTTVETSKNKQIVNKLTGSIEMNNVSFKYKEDMPLILNNVSLKIRAGQYVAIVGKSGCGKSTFMRLLLGFEKPQKGAIYYDNKDINALDLKSLRSKMGVVMQNGKLFVGDIFSNITISAPSATMDEAWKAAEMVGLAEDLKKMPMGMHTLISEGSGGISGGQKQRILIARAIVSKPRILLFDEATSALDNITQKIVSDSLNNLKCTRVVIAHRLSTIKLCDRIIMIEDGRIVEDGSYEQLIKINGKFAEFVERQIVENK